jgi:hypothetical protein
MRLSIALGKREARKEVYIFVHRLNTKAAQYHDMPRTLAWGFWTRQKAGKHDDT